MFSNNTVKKMVSDALHELNNSAGLSWINKSSLTKRAYIIGLYSGLSGIAEKEILNKLLLEQILETMWQREADDYFTATSIGREYEKLKNILQCRKPIDSDFRNTTKSLQHDIERHDQKWQSFYGQAQEVMDEIIQVSSMEEAEDEMDNGQQNERRDKLHRLLDHLGTLVRQITIIDSDHRIGNRFEQ